MKKYLTYFLLFMVLMVISGGVYFFLVYYEGEKPVITISEPLELIGNEKIIRITCTDRKCGLRQISVTITQDGKLKRLETVDIPRQGTSEETLLVEINPKNLHLRDGKASLEISAVDYSLRKNVSIKTFNVVIDTIPPQIYQLNSSHYINPGGSCVVLFRIPEEIKKSYVFVNDDHFAAHSATISGKPGYICYFAIPPDTKKEDTKIGIVAEDKAGNLSINTLPVFIRNKKFRRRTLNISKQFLERKIPELQQFSDMILKETLMESFVYINEVVRADNFKTIQTICGKTEGKQLWEGTFLRMKNAANMAQFGDKRTYYYDGKNVSTSIHVGVDLASTKNAVVHASNSGKVVFTGYLGIYGNSIIIDHGLGLFSFYAHLGAIKVSDGQSVAKGDPIGNTDTSGLAGGDHLHFGILVGNQFVDPQEWWDPHWIRDNVEKKLNVAF